jgi:hypothetical protein
MSSSGSWSPFVSEALEQPSRERTFQAVALGCWAERPIPLDASTEFGVYIGAIDPEIADRVYLRSTGASRLYVTGDAGRSFQVPLTFVGPMMGLALAPDGAHVYAGGPEDGLFVAAARDGADAGLAFVRASSVPVQCLATRGAELWACADGTTRRDAEATSPTQRVPMRCPRGAAEGAR